MLMSVLVWLRTLASLKVKEKSMNTNQETLTLHEGMDVFGTDGEKLGSVDHIEGDYIVAKMG